MEGSVINPGLNIITDGRNDYAVCCLPAALSQNGVPEMKHPGSKGSHAYNASVIFLHVAHIHTVYWLHTAPASYQSSHTHNGLVLVLSVLKLMPKLNIMGVIYTLP